MFKAELFAIKTQKNQIQITTNIFFELYLLYFCAEHLFSCDSILLRKSNNNHACYIVNFVITINKWLNFVLQKKISNTEKSCADYSRVNASLQSKVWPYMNFNNLQRVIDCHPKTKKHATLLRKIIFADCWHLFLNH